MTLNLDSFGDSPKKNNNKYKAALGVGSVLGLFGIGSTLAANISLNGGGNVEFGQGVATTAACDEDGFSITPVTRYDNDNAIFRVSSLQITGINLSPEGSKVTQLSYDELGITDKNADSSIDQTDAKLQYPGQYYDGSDWKRTCDNVVLDFKSYTNDSTYAKYTTSGYMNPTTTGTTEPLYWSQRFDGSGNLYGSDQNTLNAPGIASAIDVWNSNDNYDTNYAWMGATSNGMETGNNIELDVVDVILQNEDSSFNFALDYNTDMYQPNAAAISKITVQSMKNYPENYYADSNNGPGTSGWTTR